MSTERKVAVITGASGGIGSALVRAYRARGYRVVAEMRRIMNILAVLVGLRLRR